MPLIEFNAFIPFIEFNAFIPFNALVEFIEFIPFVEFNAFIPFIEFVEFIPFIPFIEFIWFKFVFNGLKPCSIVCTRLASLSSSAARGLSVAPSENSRRSHVGQTNEPGKLGSW